MIGVTYITLTVISVSLYSEYGCRKDSEQEYNEMIQGKSSVTRIFRPEKPDLVCEELPDGIGMA